MSFWTHIVAVIDYDTFRESHTLVGDILEDLKQAPKITGSEQDAEIFVNQLSGYNVYTSQDCGRCQYEETIKDDGDCYCPEDFKCPSGKYQTRVVITIIGDLRDRMKEQTENEWENFKSYIEDNLAGDIRNISCSIEGY